MKKLVSLLLCAGFCMGLAIPGHAAGMAYEEAVAGLRKVNYGTYGEEQTYDSDLCTLFSYSVTARHGPFAHLDLVYKAGSPLGEGTVISLPVPDQNAWGASSAPETLDWDPEGGRLSYSYYFDTPIYAEDFSSLRRAAGTFTYTVDLHTGEIAESHTPPLEPARTYDQAVAELRGRSSYCCETVYESELCSVFSYSISGTPHGTFSFLELVYKAGSPLGEGVVLNLPLIKINDWQVTISPDEITLNEDKTVLTYKYHFDTSLTNGDSDRVYYKAGTYIYTVDLATGELEVAHTGEVPSPAQPTVNVFTDVPAGNWFEKGVATCAGKGVMVGTGGDSFSPERELSQAECLTLAFRLYDLMQGNEHAVEKAPEDWGKLTLTLSDGTVFEGYGYQSEANHIFSWWSGRNGYEGACAQVPGWTYGDLEAGAKAQREWMDAHKDICGADAPATLTLNGVTYQGTANCWMPVGSYVFQFEPEYEKTAEVNAILHHAVFREVGPDRWWRDTAYTITQRELEDIFDPVEFSSLPASRSFFAQLIADACEGHLEKINTIGDIPDLPREFPGPVTYPKAELYRDAVYALYEAGILTGVDEAGTFAADNTLTRAEAAVMVARALDETQQISRDRSYHGIVGSLETEAGHEQETYFYSDASFRLPDNVTLILRYKPCAGDQSKRDYELWLVRREGAPQALRLSLPSTEVLSDGSAPTTRVPDSIQTVPDPSDPERNVTLTYTYRFPEPLWNGNTMLHDKGTYTYTVDIPTGEQSAVLEDAYEKALADAKATEYPWQVDQQLEAPLCTILVKHSDGGSGLYPGASILLIFKEGSPNGAGEVVSLPLLSGTFRYGSFLPDTIELDPSGTTLIYPYHYETDQYALTLSATPYLAYRRGPTPIRWTWPPERSRTNIRPIKRKMAPHPDGRGAVFYVLP